MQQLFSDDWVEILNKNLPPYAKLSDVFRGELHDNIRIFLAEKSFEGCGGLVITDEIRATIAAQACILLLNRADNCYPKLSSVLVYPSAYVVGGDRTSQKEHHAVLVQNQNQHGCNSACLVASDGAQSYFLEYAKQRLREFLQLVQPCFLHPNVAVSYTPILHLELDLQNVADPLIKQELLRHLLHQYPLNSQRTIQELRPLSLQILKSL